MSKHEIALLSRIYTGPLPMSLTVQADIEAARVLHGIGFIQAVFEKPSKGRDDHGQLGRAIVKSVLIDPE